MNVNNAVKACTLTLGIILLLSVSGCLEQLTPQQNIPPQVFIHQPSKNTVVLGPITINGTASDPDDTIAYVELHLPDTSSWKKAQGTTNWTYAWSTYGQDNGPVTIRVRAWDKHQFSPIKEQSIIIDNPQNQEYNTNRWAVFVAAANFPEDPREKLGNGGLYLAENMSTYFIEKLGYSTSNIYLLFDDGWIRNNSGFGQPKIPLDQRPHRYNITYGAATKNNVISTLNKVISEANQVNDAEVFIWLFNHGFGDYNRAYTGGKILEPSAIFVWDDYLTDQELGSLLEPLTAAETCIIIDACYIGGFADRTIYNIPTLPRIRSNIPQQQRVVITSTSKFRTGIAIIAYGPLFTLLWFDGIITGAADGFRPGLLHTGRLPMILFQDGLVSVEEAFYYARYLLRTVEGINEYQTMQPQINDRYPSRGFLRSRPGLILGE